MSVEYLKILEKALEGIELTEEENRLVEWIAGWDLWTVQQFRQIIKKCRESDNQDFKGTKKEPYGSARRFHQRVWNFNHTRVCWRLCVPCYLIQL